MYRSTTNNNINIIFCTIVILLLGFLFASSVSGSPQDSKDNKEVMAEINKTTAEVIGNTLIKVGFSSQKLQDKARNWLEVLEDAYSFLKPLSDPAHPELRALSYQEYLSHQVQGRQNLGRGDYWGAVNDFSYVIAGAIDPPNYQTSLLFALSVAKMVKVDNSSIAKISDIDKTKFIGSIMHAYKLAQTYMEKAACLWLIDYTTGVSEFFKDTGYVNATDIQKYLSEQQASYPQDFAAYNIEKQDGPQGGTVLIHWTHPILVDEKNRINDFVEVTPKLKDLTISSQGSDLRISPLPFGESYRIAIKAGLKSINSHKLLKEQIVTSFVPNRQAMANFRENGYILPRHGAQILPFDNTNTKQVAAKIFSLSENSLTNLLNRFDLIDHKDNQDIFDEYLGDLVWEGSIDTHGQQNKITTFGLPIDKMLSKKLQPGLYVAFINEKNSFISTWQLFHSNQWFIVTDLGISSYIGPDGMHVIVRSLKTGSAIKDANVTIIAKNNKHLATSTTNKHGYAHFSKPKTSGLQGNAPAFVLVKTHDKLDLSFLALSKLPYDLKDFGDEGLAPSPHHKAFMYTERGIYRPGEEVNVVALLRDNKGNAVKDVPLIFKLNRPDGKEFVKEVVADLGAGSHFFTIPSNSLSLSGVWSVLAYVDPKAAPVAKVDFIVKDFVPNQIEVKLEVQNKSHKESSKPVVYRNEPLDYLLTVKYLFGSPAKALQVKANTSLQLRTTSKNMLPKWPGYFFGLEEEEWVPKKLPIVNTSTDLHGQAVLTWAMTDEVKTSRILDLVTEVDVFEPSGRTKTLTSRIPFMNQAAMLGIAPKFKDRIIPYDSIAKFNIIAVDQYGEKSNDIYQGKYTLYSERDDYMWFKKYEQWYYEAVVTDHEEQKGEFKLSSDRPARLALKVKSGRYRLEVRDANGLIKSSLRFTAGWQHAGDKTHKRPERIDVVFDQKSYKPGDIIKVKLLPPYDGKLVLFEMGQNLKTVHESTITKSGAIINVKISPDLADISGFYLYATVFRPAFQDKEGQPSRAIGLGWVSLDTSSKKLDFKIKLPELVKPNTTVPIKVSFAPPTGGEVFMTMAAVDESLLQLTNFNFPDPYAFLFSQTAMPFKIIDFYSDIINPNGAKATSFHVGGSGLSDDFIKMAMKIPDLPTRSSKILSLFNGIVPVINGEAVIPVNIPEFSGRMRIMAVAWSQQKVGAATEQATVRNSVVAKLSLPRFLSVGDEISAHLLVNNVTGTAGIYKLKVAITKALSGTSIGEQEFTLNLKDKEQKILPVQLKGKYDGIGVIDTILTTPSGDTIASHDEVTVLDQMSFPTLRHTLHYIAPGKSVAFDETLTSGLTENSKQGSVLVASAPLYGQASLRKLLKDYPYGCLEQISSRGFAFLDSSGVVEKLKNQDQTAINLILSDLFNLQTLNGSFVMWPHSMTEEPWLSTYAIDFLISAQQQGVKIPSISFDAALHWLESQTYTDMGNPPSYNAIEVTAYAHYLLAKIGRGDISRLRYFAQASKEQMKTPQSKALIAAAFALLGNSNFAQEWYEMAVVDLMSSNIKDNIYISDLVQNVMVAKLLSETTSQHPKLPKILDNIAMLQARVPNVNSLSTHEQAWLLRLMTLLNKDGQNYRAKILGKEISGGKPYQQILDKAFFSKQNTINSLRVENIGDKGLWTLYEVNGRVKTNIKKSESFGFTIERKLFNESGKLVDPALVKQGELYVVHLSGQIIDKGLKAVLITDLLPAGFEIVRVAPTVENLPELLRPLLVNSLPPLMTEGRDDRFVTVFEQDNQPKFSVFYMVRAITPGTFVYPKPKIENMYHPDRFAEGLGDTLIVAGS